MTDLQGLVISGSVCGWGILISSLGVSLTDWIQDVEVLSIIIDRLGRETVWQSSSVHP